MMQILGYFAFAVAALLAGANFYLSFVRAPIHWLLGWEYHYVSGIPMVGTVFLIGALALLEWSPLVWIGAIALCAIDTGGLVWFCLVMAWEIIRKKE